MKKSKRPVIPVLIDESLEQMRAALVAHGYILPTRVEDFTNDDLSLYGQGEPQCFASLQSSARARAKRQNTNKPDETTYESMAMAARNGKQISKDVWARMQTDRLSVETRIKDKEQ